MKTRSLNFEMSMLEAIASLAHDVDDIFFNSNIELKENEIYRVMYLGGSLC